MLQPWATTFGTQIVPPRLTNPLARRLRDFLLDEGAGIGTLVDVRRGADGAELVIFEIETNRPQRPACEILYREPVGIIFPACDGPPTVYAMRPDFPDTFHQNIVPEGFPASLCVDDRPWQEAKPLYTAAELVHRIMRWFERAGRGQLHDARQPLDPFFLPTGMDIVFPREIFELGIDEKAELFGITADARRPRVVKITRDLHDLKPGMGAAAFVFISYQVAPTAMRRLRWAPTTLQSLIRELRERGLDLAEDLSRKMDAWLKEDLASRFDFKLGILVRMPIVAPNGTVSNAVDDMAFFTVQSVGEIGAALGRLRVSPSDVRGGPRYVPLLQPDAANACALGNVPIQMARAHVDFDSVRAAELAGRAGTSPRRIVLVGAGAIGSLTAESLVREGYGEHWTIIDDDDLLPHNLVRHTLGRNEVGERKAVKLAHRLASIRAALSAIPIVANVLAGGDQTEAVSAAIREADLIIDAAASVPVARFLNDHEGSARRASIFFNPAGTAVVLLLEDAERKHDLRSLEAAYYGQILRDDGLSEHLTQSAGEIRYTGACRAATNRIPASRAQTLSGLVAGSLAEGVGRAESRATIWTMSNDGSVQVCSVAHDNILFKPLWGWAISISRSLEERLLAMRAAKAPIETGGVLFGIVDLLRRRIDIVEGWPEPPDSKGTEAGFQRGTQCLYPAVIAAIGRTLDQVRYIGEWHSHPPRVSTTPSGTDIDQILWLTGILAVDGCPAIMLIVGEDDVQLCLGGSIHDDRGL